MSAEATTTELGTRIIMLQAGGTIGLTKHEAETVFLTAMVGDHKLRLALTPSEALNLIEALAVAARPGTGKALIEALPELPEAVRQE